MLSIVAHIPFSLEASTSPFMMITRRISVFQVSSGASHHCPLSSDPVHQPGSMLECHQKDGITPVCAGSALLSPLSRSCPQHPRSNTLSGSSNCHGAAAYMLSQSPLPHYRDGWDSLSQRIGSKVMFAGQAEESGWNKAVGKLGKF